LSSCLINSAPRYEDVRRSGCTAPPFLTSALDGGEWPASGPSSFTPEGARSGHCIGWVGLRAGLDAVENRKISCPFRESNPAVQLVDCRYTGRLKQGGEKKSRSQQLRWCCQLEITELNNSIYLHCCITCSDDWRQIMVTI
jgi:hypothetical protein